MGMETGRGNYLPSLAAGLGLHQPSCWAIRCNSLATITSWSWFEHIRGEGVYTANVHSSDM